METAADVRVCGTRAAVFPAFFEKFRHADESGLQIPDHTPLVAGVQEFCNPFKTRFLLEGADAAFLIQADQHAAQGRI